MQSLIDAAAEPGYPAEISLVISNRADAYGLERAQASGIETAVISQKDYEDRAAFDAALDAARQAHIHTALDDNTFSQLLSEGIQRFVATINQAFDAISLECQAISQQQRHGPATLIA